MSAVAESDLRFADEHFGDRLRRARYLQSLSQRELSEQTSGEVTERTVRNWENGRSSPKPGHAIRVIAALLRTTPAFLLWGERFEKEE